MKKIRFVLILLCFFNIAYAGSVETLIKQLNQIKTFKADFKQTVKSENAMASDPSTGTVTIKKSTLFKWDTKKPLHQIIIADGQSLWIYDVALEQITKQLLDKSMDNTAAEILVGKAENLSRLFEIKPEGTKDGADVYRLKPKSSQSHFALITIYMKGGKVTGMDLQDNLEQITQIAFTHIQTNVAIEDNYFHFTAPKGIDVIDNTKKP